MLGISYPYVSYNTLEGECLRIILEMTSFCGSRLFPSSYNVTSPSNVARSNGPDAVTPMICAVFKMRRISLNDGGTKRREEMNR